MLVNKKNFVYLHFQNGPVAQLNRVSDYGSEGSRFESWRGHLIIRELRFCRNSLFLICTKNLNVAKAKLFFYFFIRISLYSYSTTKSNIYSLGHSISMSSTPQSKTRL